MDEYLKNIYNKLRADGKLSQFNTFEEFQNHVSSEEKLEKFHGFLTSNNYKVSPYPEFKQLANVKKKEPALYAGSSTTSQKPIAEVSQKPFDIADNFRESTALAPEPEFRIPEPVQEKPLWETTGWIKPPNSPPIHASQIKKPFGLFQYLKDNVPGSDIEYLSNAFARGVENGKQANLLNAFSDIENMSDEDYARLAESIKASRKYETSPYLENIVGAESFGEAIRNLGDKPWISLPEAMIESFTAQAIHGFSRIASGVVAGAGMGSVIPGYGTIIGAGTGAVAGIGMSSLNLEATSNMMEILQERGYDTENPEDLKEGLKDPTIQETARLRGIPVAIFDMLSAGIAGHFTKSLKNKAIGSIVDVGVQGAMGSAGEFTKQAIFDDKISWGDVIIEFAAEIPMGIAEIRTATVMDKAANRNKKEREEVINQVAANTPPAAVESLIAFSEGAGILTPEEGQELRAELENTREAQSRVLEPSNVEDVEFVKRKMAIEQELQELEAKKATTDDLFHPIIDKSIQDAQNRLDQVKKEYEVSQQAAQEAGATPELSTTENTQEEVSPEGTDGQGVVGGSRARIASRLGVPVGEKQALAIELERKASLEAGDMNADEAADAQYVDAVKNKQTMTKEQALASLEKAGRKDSAAYAEISQQPPQEKAQQVRPVDELKAEVELLKQGKKTPEKDAKIAEFEREIALQEKKDMAQENQAAPTDVQGYKFTNTPALSKDEFTIEIIPENQLLNVENEIFLTDSKKTLAEGVNNEGGGWYSQRDVTSGNVFMYNTITKEGLLLIPKKGGRLDVLIDDFIRNNNRETKDDSVSTKKEEVETKVDDSVGGEVDEVTMTDNELQQIVGRDVFKQIQRSEEQLGEGVVDRNRMIETAKRIQKADKKDKLLPEHIFEALQYETGFPDNWQDLRNAIKKGGIDINSESVQRQIEVGVNLPKDIVEEFKKSERYKNASPELVRAVEQSIKEEPKAESKAPEVTDLGGGIKNNTKDSDHVVPITEIDNLRQQRQTDLATGNAIEIEGDINKNGLEESVVVIYYPNEGVAQLGDGHTRLDVLKDNGATSIPIRVVERYTDPPESAKSWNPPVKEVNQVIEEKQSNNQNNESTGRIDKFSERADRDSAPSQSDQGKEAKGDGAGVPKRRRTGNRKPIAERKTRDPRALTILNSDAIDPRSLALKWFIDRGRLTTDALRQYFPDVKKWNEKKKQFEVKVAEEVRSRIGMLNNKTGLKSLESIAEEIWNQAPDYIRDNLDTRDIIAALEDIIMAYESIGAMIEDNYQTYGEQIQEEPSPYIEQQYFEDAYDIWEVMTDEEKQAFIESNETPDDAYLAELESRAAETVVVENPILGDLQKKIDKAKIRVESTKKAYDKKRKELDTELVNDQSDLFGNRKTDGGLFDDQRASLSARNKVAQALKADYEKAVADLKRLEKEYDTYKDTQVKTLFDETEKGVDTKDDGDAGLATREQQPEGDSKGIQPSTRDSADKAKAIRNLKIDTKGKMLDATAGIPIVIWNGAVELVAKSVESGIALNKAIAKAIKYIDQKMQGKKWDKGFFAKEMNVRFNVTLQDGRVVEVERKTDKETAEVINGWYSPLEQAILDTKIDKLPVKQWIDKFANTEEAKWTGLTDWLGQQQGSVSKADIQKYLKENRIQIVEVVKGSAKDNYDIVKNQEESDYAGEDVYDLIDKTNGITSFTGSLDEAKARADQDNSRENKNAPKFATYQLEGEKENYKEVLVTLPSKSDVSDVALELYGKSLKELTKNEFRNAQEIGSKRNANKFNSTHFDEPNILVHLRMNTRTDAQGNKVLFLEEVQSDWGQKGKKEGFDYGRKKELESQRKDLRENNEYRILQKQYLDPIAQEKYGEDYGRLTHNKQMEVDFEYFQKDKSLLDKIEKAQKKLIEDLNNIDNEIAKLDNKENIPTAPFVTDTNDWTKLGLKVALKEAVAQGVDKIAWTTGEQQNDRYDLSKQVDEIKVLPQYGGSKMTYSIQGFKNEQMFASQSANTIAELEGIVGKEIATKVAEKGEYEGELSFKGDDLKVGGKGMKGFYGNPTDGSKGIVGGVAEKLFGQKLGTVDMFQSDKLANGYSVTIKDKQGNVSTQMFDSKSKGLAWLSKQDGIEIISEDAEGKNYSTQHSIDITPELKESVEKGVPLFQGLSAEAKLKEAYNEWKQKKGNIGFYFDPKSEADADVKLIKAFVEYVSAKLKEGAYELADFIQDIKKDFGATLDNAQEVFANILLRIDPKHEPDDSNISSGEVKRVAKRVIDRVLSDPRISAEQKAAIRAGGTLRDVLPNDYVNEIVNDLVNDIIQAYGNDIGIPALVREAKDLLKDAIEDPSTNPESAAMAMSILQKVALMYAQQGDNKKFADLYQYIDSLGVQLGRGINMLSQLSTPEAMANKLIAQVTTDTAQMIEQLSEENKRLYEQLKEVYEQLKVTKEELDGVIDAVQAKIDAAVKEVEQNRKKEAAEVSVKSQKAQIRQKRQELIGDLKTKLNNLGITPNDLEIYDVIGQIAQTYFDEGIIEIKKIKDKIVKELTNAGIKDPNRLVEEAYAAGSIKDRNKDSWELGDKIREVIKNHYEKPLYNQLYRELMALGISESKAKAIQTQVEAEIRAKVAGRVDKYIQENKQITDPKRMHEIALAALSQSGMTPDQFQSMFNVAFGLPNINAQQIQMLQRLAQAASGLINGNAFNSPEWKARKLKEFKMLLKELEAEQSGVLKYLPEEIVTMVTMNALTGFDTQINANAGSFWTAIGRLGAYMLANPQASIHALINAIKTEQFGIGMGVYKDSFFTNFSALDDLGTFIDGDNKVAPSFMEAVALKGLGKYANQMRTNPSMKNALMLAYSGVLQSWRLGFVLKGVDGMISHPGGEIVRYIDEYNKQAKALGMGTFKTPSQTIALLKEVDKHGRFGKVAWQQAKQQAANDIATLKSQGEKIPIDFERRRAKELILEQVEREKVLQAYKFMKEAVMMGEPTGLAGGMYRTIQRSLSINKDNPTFKNAALLIPKLVVGLFVRVAMNGMNYAWRSTPFIGVIDEMVKAPYFFLSQLGKELGSGKAVSESAKTALSFAHDNVWSEYVGTEAMKKVAQERQLGNGWVKKTDSQVKAILGLQVAVTAIGVGLLMDMLDYDDEEDKWTLSESRHFDITLDMTKDYTKNVSSDGMKPFSIRWRADTSKPFGDWSYQWKLAMPLVPIFSFLGGTRDDIMYRAEEFNLRTNAQKGMKGFEFMLSTMSELTINNQLRNVKMLFKASEKGGKTGSTIQEISSTMTEITSRPVKTLIQPNLARDIYNEIRAEGLDMPMRKAQSFSDRLKKDLILTDWMIKGERFDEYGNPIFYDSKIFSIPRLITKPFEKDLGVFKYNNDKIFEQPEWKVVRKYPEVLSAGMWYPNKTYTVNKQKIALTDDQRFELQKEFAEINGTIVRHYSEVLDALKPETLQYMLNEINSYSREAARAKAGLMSRTPKLKVQGVLDGLKRGG